MVARVICFFLGHILAFEQVRPGQVVRCVRCHRALFVLPPTLDPDTIDDCPHPHHRRDNDS